MEDIADTPISSQTSCTYMQQPKHCPNSYVYIKTNSILQNLFPALRVVALLGSYWLTPVITWAPVLRHIIGQSSYDDVISVFGAFEDLSQSAMTVVKYLKWTNICECLFFFLKTNIKTHIACKWAGTFSSSVHNCMYITLCT